MIPHSTPLYCACYVWYVLCVVFVGARIRFDGGEYVTRAGEMNVFRSVLPEQWDAVEQMIRGFDRKQK